MEFPSLDCLVWGEPAGSLVLHTDQKTLIKTASQAALEGGDLKEGLSVGGSSRSLPTLLCQGFIIGKPGAAFSRLQKASALAGAFQENSRKFQRLLRSVNSLDLLVAPNGKEGKWGERTLGLTVGKVIPLQVRRVSDWGLR